jgi:hypothetical protein
MNRLSRSSYGRCDDSDDREGGRQMPLRILAQAPGEAGTGARQEHRSAAGQVIAARRRALQVTLGLIWLLDAALQFQPYMFTTAFVS